MKIFNVIYNIFAITITLVFLLTVGVMVTGTEVYAVATPSMEDQIPEGSIVFVHSADEYSRGEVITAALSNGNTFTHRIISVDKEAELIYTKGDSNPSPDPLPTSLDDVVGKVVFSVPYLGFLSLNFNSSTVIFVLAAVLIVLMIIRFIVFKKAPKEVSEK
ncbi:MAG: signal peptidase I [Clostridia bacterium]|nr:signal peptidase I [Clostridia bacterium]